jgi:hypothetical protein
MLNHAANCTHGPACHYTKRYYPADQVAAIFPGATNLHYQPRRGLLQGHVQLYTVTNFHRLPLELLAVTTKAAHSSKSNFRGIFFHVHKANFAPTLKFLRDGNTSSLEAIVRLANGLASYQKSVRNPILEFKDGTLTPASITAYRNRVDLCAPPPMGRTDGSWFCTTCFAGIPVWRDEGSQCHSGCSSNNPRKRDFLRHLWDIRICYYTYAFAPNLQNRPGMFLTRMTRRALGEDSFRLDLHHSVFPTARIHQFHRVPFPNVGIVL